MVTIYIADISWTPDDEEYWWAVNIAGYDNGWKGRPAYYQLSWMERYIDDTFIPARDPGDPEARLVAPGSDLRTDLPAQLLWLLSHEHFAGMSPQVLYYSLREGRAREVTLDDDLVAAVTHELRSRTARLRREVDFAPRKGRYCRWCHSRARCPLWQR